MTIIYKKNDLITLKIADLTFKIKPLAYMERVEIMACSSKQEGSVIENAAKATYLAIKYAVKDFQGAKLIDGSDYKLEFDNEGYVSEESINDILNIENNNKLGLALNNFLKGVPTKLINPFTNEELEGVEIIQQTGQPKK